MKILMTIVLACLLAGPSMAGEGAGSGWGRITELYMTADGLLLRIRFSRPVENPDGCEGAEFYVRELDESVGSDRFFRAVLAAHTAGRDVEFWVSGCSQSPWWGKTRPQVYDIYIRD